MIWKQGLPARNTAKAGQLNKSGFNGSTPTGSFLLVLRHLVSDLLPVRFFKYGEVPVTLLTNPGLDCEANGCH